MRVFFPTTKALKKRSGVAVGWTLGQDVIVVTVVDEWRDELAQSTAGVKLQKLGQVVALDGKNPGGVSAQGGNLVIYTVGGQPAGLSTAAEVVTYAPPKLSKNEGLPTAGAEALGQQGKEVTTLINSSDAVSAAVAPAKNKSPLPGLVKKALIPVTLYSKLLARPRKQLKAGLGMRPDNIAPRIPVWTWSAQPRPPFATKLTLPEKLVKHLPAPDHLKSFASGTGNYLLSLMELPPFTPQETSFRSAQDRFKGKHTNLYVRDGTLAPWPPTPVWGVKAIMVAQSWTAAADVLLYVVDKVPQVKRSFQLLSNLQGLAPSPTVSLLGKRALQTVIASGEDPHGAGASIKLDMLLGFLVASLCAIAPLPSLQPIQLVSATQSLLLRTAEAVKPYDTPLGERASAAVMHVLDVWKGGVVAATQYVSPSLALYIASIFGLSFVLALGADMLSALAAPLHVAYDGAAKFAAGLAGFGGKISGKPLPTSVVLGPMLLLAAALAPSLAVYAVLTIILYRATYGAVSTLSLASGYAGTIPIKALMSRVIAPKRVPAAVMIADAKSVFTKDDKPPMLHLPERTRQLKTSPVAYADIVRAWTREANDVVRRV